MPAVKTVIPFSAQLVQFETTLPPTEVISRLDEKISRERSKELIPSMAAMKSKEELEEIVARITQGGDFMHFLSVRHDNWLKYFNDKVPIVAVYTIANPLVAEAIMKHDLRSSYNIPPRLLILEKEDRSGTLLAYHLPSSVMALDPDNQELQAAARVLDEKYEKLIIDVTS
ncbi:hypothetical protein V5O48_004264 [Marasmius crinis-equi]|uniref:DUF302 domain-containing protein n=1 Tax=Marasmius crinis-equi TaxID=585013 RepID=A0ABR3FRH7_9AGAR